ncbi:MAG: hypothetical protein MMC33_010416 [Icmadophila ericetorum]|nr:hypothetical protein [Icmadophila ericetorum]
MASQPAHQRLVFTDPVAFRYLEEDPATIVLERRRELEGYELYIVEQWACSRVHPTFVITTYTGLPQHKVFVSVLSVPTDENAWSQRLRVYLRAISEFHARKKETPLGILMVTNLSGFPSALTVITVPGGDVKSHRDDFIVNENMKRLGCSGRAGLTLSPPIGTTKAKFIQLYHTSSRVPLPHAVIELVRLCQVALVFFTKLGPEYADGLLCDVTERAINDWWTEVGIEYFNVEPGDGILGPTTVAALLGMLLGARNRLHAYGAPVGKDVFDLRATKRAIAYFQKALKIDRTRRLDRQTLERLHRATSKAASGDGWTVPKAVKSTVVELSGKSGEMVMGMVGGRDKAGIAEVETLDIETFIQFLSGENCKWLWYGKPRKNNSSDLFGNLSMEDEMVFSGDENGGYMWASRKRDSMSDGTYIHHSNLNHLYMQPNHSSQASFDQSEKDQGARKTVFKSVTGKMSDAKSGLGRIKDAVSISGLRGHQHKISKDGDLASEISNRGTTRRSNTNPDETESPPPSPRFDTQTNSPHASLRPQLEPESEGSSSADDCDHQDPPDSRNEPAISQSRVKTSSSEKPLNEACDDPSSKDAHKKLGEAVKLPRLIEDPSLLERKQELIGSPAHSGFGSLPHLISTGLAQSTARRKFSSPELAAAPSEKHDVRWPRHLSFSIAESVLVTNDEVLSQSDTNTAQSKVSTSLTMEGYLALGVSHVIAEVQQVIEHDELWVKQRVYEVEKLDAKASSDQKDLDSMHYQQLEDYNNLYEATRDLIRDRKTYLDTSLKGIGNLGAKLEYEMNALHTKIHDVEEGVTEFERQVLDIETRAEELEEEKSDHKSWFGWFSRLFHGIG